MADAALLTIETPSLRVELRGPFQNPLGSLHPSESVSVSARLDLVSTEELLTATFVDSSGVAQQWSRRSGGPSLFESTRYRVTVLSKLSGAPRAWCRDPTLLREIDRVADLPALAGFIDFKRQVGLSTLEFAVGEARLSVTVEVFPTKIDYASDYRALLSEVGAIARGLALEFLRATHLRGAKGDGGESTDLEWIFLLRRYIAEIEAALRFIQGHPHRLLHPSLAPTRPEKIRRVDGALSRAVARGAGSGEFRMINGVWPIRSRLPATTHQGTLDTPEHRWLRVQLEAVRDRIAMLLRDLIDERAKQALQGEASKRIDREIVEVRELSDRIEEVLRTPVLSDARVSQASSGFSSLTLMNAPGYGEAFRALLALQAGLSLDGDFLNLSVKDLDVLYEMWCFIRLAAMLVRASRGTTDIGDVVAVDAQGIRVRLKRGQKSSVPLRDATRELILSYNRHFRGMTGDQRPDIVLELRHPGWPPIVVLFDAKYRVDASAQYVAQFGAPGPPIDAVNALHRYRDAIVLSGPHAGRPVVKGVALFPSADKSFSKHRLFDALGELGVGALPFLPGNTEQAEQWLSALLAIDVSDLSCPGPPFLAHEHLRRGGGA